jgi:hypothetical protein
MNALASTEYRHNSETAVHPIECHRRSKPQWRGRRPASSPQADPESPPGRRDQCPRCGTIAAGPILSAPQPGGVIAHHWTCESCKAGWDTFFRPLLV